MLVVIPAQTKSIRVPLKNIRAFYENDSLLDVKIKQLLKVFPKEKIFISSEDDVVKDICDKYSINYLPRPLNLTGNDILQGDLIGDILNKLPDTAEDIMWVQVTQPLFNRFPQMLEAWDNVKDTNDSLVAVKTLRHHLVSSAGIPVNFNFGCWHRVSQNLPKFYEIMWSAFIQKRASMELTKYHIGMNPYYMPFDDCMTVDIDTLDDFELASMIYKKKIEKDLL